MRFFTRSRLGLFLLLLVFASGLGLYSSSRGVARAVDPSHIWLSNKVAPPTASVLLNGGGFGLNETVTIDFDTTQIGTAITDATGKFALRITVPKTALPGTHIVQATGQTSGLTAQTPFLVQTNWAQYRFGPYDTGNNPYENVLTSSNVSTLTLDWSYTTGGRVYSSAAVANGVVYIGSADHRLCALDAMTGAPKWSYTTGGAIYSSSPAVANGVVYVGTGYPDDKLYALDAMIGTLKWSYTTESSITSSPTVANGVVYVGTGYLDDKLYALDAVTGALKWSYTTESSITSSPAVANNVVYVGSSIGVLYALDTRTGTLKWSYNTANAIVSSPAVANGVVYIGLANGKLNDGKLYALDAVTGTLKWSYTMGRIVDSSSVVANGVVYIGSLDHNLYAFHLPNMSS